MPDMLGPYLLGPNDENHGVYTGDILNLMTQIPTKTVDAIIVDPPYCSGAISESRRTQAKGQGLRSETIRRFGWFVGDNMGTSGLTWLLRQMALETTRVVKDSGSFLCFCDWRMFSAIQPAIESAGLRFQNLVVWNKESMGLGFGFRHQHELILHFTLGAPKYYDASVSTVINCRRVTIYERTHQTEKPIHLLANLIKVVSPIGGVILDPMAGSCSTAVAAKLLGRKWLTFEIDPGTAEMARERVRNTQPPLPLIMPEQKEMVLDV